MQNCYPGARVDSPVPIYELAIPEVYKDWYWTTNYPNWEELQAYFDHIDKTLNLSKDCAFETVVNSCEFDENETKWTVKTADGRTAKTRFLIVAAGFAAKRCKHVIRAFRTSVLTYRKTSLTSQAWTTSREQFVTLPSGPRRALTTRTRRSLSSGLELPVFR